MLLGPFAVVAGEEAAEAGWVKAVTHNKLLVWGGERAGWGEGGKGVCSFPSIE